jgi:hypothetical protein
MNSTRHQLLRIAALLTATSFIGLGCTDKVDDLPTSAPQTANPSDYPEYRLFDPGAWTEEQLDDFREWESLRFMGDGWYHQLPPSSSVMVTGEADRLADHVLFEIVESYWPQLGYIDVAEPFFTFKLQALSELGSAIHPVLVTKLEGILEGFPEKRLGIDGVQSIAFIFRIFQSSDGEKSVARAAVREILAHRHHTEDQTSASSPIDKLHTNAINLLAAIGEPSDQQSLFRFLHYQNSGLRYCAMIALGNIGDETAIPELEKFSERLAEQVDRKPYYDRLKADIEGAILSIRARHSDAPLQEPILTSEPL